MITQQYLDNEIKALQYWLSKESNKILTMKTSGIEVPYQRRIDFEIARVLLDVLYKYNCPQFVLFLSAIHYGSESVGIKLVVEGESKNPNGTTNQVINIIKDWVSTSSIVTNVYVEGDELNTNEYRIMFHSKNGEDITVVLDGITGVESYQLIEYSNDLTEEELLQILELIHKITNFKTDKI